MTGFNPWFASIEEAFTFAGVLVRADRLDTPQLVLDYFEKPYKWSPEHDNWVACDRPDLDDEGWTTFLKMLEEGQ